MTATSADEQLVLDALASQAEPVAMMTIVRSLNPRPAPRPGRTSRYVDTRTREGRAWCDRDVQLMSAFIELWHRGALVDTPDPGGPRRFALAQQPATPPCHLALVATNTPRSMP